MPLRRAPHNLRSRPRRPTASVPTTYNRRSPLTAGRGRAGRSPSAAPANTPPAPPPLGPDDWAARLAFARQHEDHLEVFDRALLRDVPIPAGADEATRRAINAVNAEFQEKRAHRARLRNNSSARRSRAARQERLDCAEARVARLADDLAAARREAEALRRVCAALGAGPDLLGPRLDRELAEMAAEDAQRERDRLADEADRPGAGPATQPPRLSAAPASQMLPQISEADMRALLQRQPPPQGAFAAFPPAAVQHPPAAAPDGNANYGFDL